MYIYRYIYTIYMCIYVIFMFVYSNMLMLCRGVTHVFKSVGVVQGCDSEVFLDEAWKKMDERGYKLSNLDVSTRTHL